VNGNDGPQGISFYEVDDEGKICFIRDIPAPSPRGFRPVGALASLVDPALRVFTKAKLVEASLAIGSAGMSLAKPLLAAEARWQAELLGDDEVRARAKSQVDADVASAPVLVYTYGLSPFSSQALALLDETGCEYKKIEVGPEWFLLDGFGSSLRSELLERTGQSSLPHIFIGGRSIGGVFTGTPGLLAIKNQGELLPALREAKAL